MTFAELLTSVRVTETSGDLTVPVMHLADDSRRITPGTAFVAVKGERVDGHAFLHHVVEARAAAIVVQDQAAMAALLRTGQRNLPMARVDDSRKAVGLLAAPLHGGPA